jgi:hypothetical protein
MLTRVNPTLDRAVILFQDVIKILHRSVLTVLLQNTLAAAIRVKGDTLDIDCRVAKPSFCSSATYLLFVSVLERLNKNKQLSFNPGVPEMLLVTAPTRRGWRLGPLER